MDNFEEFEVLNFLRGLPICFNPKVKQRFYEDFVMYFDWNKELTSLKESANAFAVYSKGKGTCRKSLAPFYWVYYLDLLLLHDKYEMLYDFVIAEPLIAKEILNEITWGVLQQFEPLKFVDISDVQVSVNFISLPLLTNIGYGIVAREGILTAKTLPRKFIRSSLWCCEDTTCVGSEGTRRVSLSSCSNCGGQVEEYVSGRDVGEFVLGRLIPVKAFQGNICSFSSVLVRLKDELLQSSCLQIGVPYRMAGVVCEEMLDVWSVQAIRHPSEALMRSPFGHSLPLPPTMASLYLEMNTMLPSSPWAFAAAVVSSLSSNLFPVSSLLNLKYGLLLSLASQKRSNCPVPVLAVGEDIQCARQLMQSVSRLAERVVHASDAPLWGSISTDHDTLVWEEAGDLTLASNGVCILGDWSKYRKHRGMGTALDCLEAGQVIMENHTELDIPRTPLPLKAAVWSYWGHVTSSKRDQLQLKTLIDVFGMPFYVDDNDSIQQELITSQILQRCSVGSTIALPAIPVEELKDYLNIITSTQVEMTVSASDLVKSFFVTCRKERGELLPMAAIQTISSLAEAHARLSLRHSVAIEDVALVIYLYEEAMSALNGTILGSDYPKLTCDQTQSVPIQVHQQMVDFSQWLNQYTKVYLP